jgi:MFS family permease
MNTPNDKRLFWACFLALITTAFGFIVRAMIMDDWQQQFGLTETQKGEIFGVGLWPFAISIVLFSLVVDRIGYGKAMAFAFVCQVGSAIITICAPMVLAKPGATADEIHAGQRAGYWMLYIGNLIVALGNGTVEAVINPVVATMFPRDKTKWLNILHAGWPGGLVIGGVLAIGMKAMPWEYRVGIIFIPAILYALLMLTCTFPVNERVAAGVPFRDMLKEAGVLTVIVATALIVFEVTRVFEGMGLIFQGDSWKQTVTTIAGVDVDYRLVVKLGIIAAVALVFGAYVRSLGRPMYFFLVLIMIPLATTELGTDSWITGLMKPAMEKLAIDSGWILVYTSFIMMVLRFFAGPIVHKLSPLGLLAVSAAIAAIGLVALSKTTGVMILAAATLYGFGKTFFWPTMLGVVSEQFPKGGALTLNMIAGIGMLGVGVVGAVFLGNIQDREVDRQLKARNPALFSQVIGDTRQSVFGEYRPLDEKRVAAASKADQETITEIKAESQKTALFTVAIFPCIMLACYLLLMAYFWAKGGYKATVLETAHAPAEYPAKHEAGITTKQAGFKKV